MANKKSDRQNVLEWFSKPQNRNRVVHEREVIAALWRTVEPERAIRRLKWDKQHFSDETMPVDKERGSRRLIQIAIRELARKGTLIEVVDPTKRRVYEYRLRKELPPVAGNGPKHKPKRKPKRQSVPHRCR